METVVVRLEICFEWWIWSGYRAIHGDTPCYIRDPMDRDGFDESTAFPGVKPNFDVFGPPRRTRKQRGWYQLKPYLPLQSPKLDNRESCPAYATPADIPPELFDSILWGLEYDRHVLSRLSLVCRHWAEHCRERLFANLQLRSRQDALDLCKFYKDPTSQFLDYLTMVYVEVKTLAEPPWLHALPTDLFRGLELRLMGPHLTLPTGCRCLRSVHPGLPRSLPHFLRRFTRLELIQLHFSRLDDLMHLLGELPDLHTLQCAKVTWDSLPIAILRRRRPVGRRYHHEIEMWDCSPTSCQALIQIEASLRKSHLMLLSADDLAALFALAPILDTIAAAGTFSCQSSFNSHFRPDIDDIPDKVTIEWSAGMVRMLFAASYLSTAGARYPIAITVISIDLSEDPGGSKATDWVKLDLAICDFHFVDTVVVGFNDRTKMLAFTKDVAAYLPLSSARYLCRYAVGNRIFGWQRVTSEWDVEKMRRGGLLCHLYD